jgi:hypothetical protein
MDDNEKAEIAEATALMGKQQLTTVEEVLATRIKPPDYTKGIGKHAGSNNHGQGVPKKIKKISNATKRRNRKK